MHLHGGTAMCQACYYAQHYGFVQCLGEFKGALHHVVRLLLVAGFHGGNHGKAGIETAVLLVLAGVHRGVVGGYHHQASVHASDGGVYKGIGGHVHTHVLHAHQGTTAGIGHAQGSLHGGLFVCTPTAMHTAFTCKDIALDEFSYLGGGSAGVGIHATQTGMYCT